jgi:23S rRNA pseudouridine1911/1915/1917 synthase
VKRLGERLIRLRIEASATPERLDRCLATALPELSRSRLKPLIEAGRVRIDGATIAEPSYRVKPGQTVELDLPEPQDAGLPAAEALALAVVYEDADLIVIDKPAGMAVHPAPGTPSGTLVNALLAHCGTSLSGIGGVRRPGIVHRLDKDTSGLIVAAKHDRAHAALAGQFAARSLSRRYDALVWGTPVPAAGEIASQIGRSPRDRKKMAVLRRGGRAALTRYRTERVLAGGACALLRCSLGTGRTHQIRVHLAWRGHPVIGDPLYGGQRRPPAALPEAARVALAGFRRQALHAAHLSLVHPTSGERLEFSAPPPADFQALLAALEAAAPRASMS